MEGARRSRVLTAGLALLALAAGGLVAYLVADGGDDGPDGTAARTETARTETATGTEPRTPEIRTPPATEDRQPSPQQVAGIEETVVALIRANEEGDAEAVCALLGEMPGTVRSCAESSGADLTALPTSDELSFESVRAGEGRGSAELVGGPRITLRRTSNGWRVTGVR